MPSLNDYIQQLRQSGGVQPQGWGYNQQYQDALNNIQGGLANLDSDKGVADRRNLEDYDTALSGLNQSRESQIKGIENRLANNGIGRSGINVKAQGQVGDKYQQSVGAINTAKARQGEDISRGYRDARAGYQAQTAQAQSQYATDEYGRQTEAAAADAETVRKNNEANDNRVFMQTLTDRILQSSQPVASPTGQVNAPNVSLSQILQQMGLVI